MDAAFKHALTSLQHIYSLSTKLNSTAKQLALRTTANHPPRPNQLWILQLTLDKIKNEIANLQRNAPTTQCKPPITKPTMTMKPTDRALWQLPSKTCD